MFIGDVIRLLLLRRKNGVIIYTGKQIQSHSRKVMIGSLVLMNVNFYSLLGYNQRFERNDILADKKYEVHLCKGCIKDLEDYFPYLIPREQLHIVEVPVDECDNSNLDNYNERLRKRNQGYSIAKADDDVACSIKE